MHRFPAICLFALLTTACSGTAPRKPAAAQDVGGNEIEAQIAGDMTAVRLKAADDRIVQLERQVGEMQATPEKLDLQLLTQRVEQLEARVYARGETTGPAPGQAAPADGPPARRGEPQPTPSPTPGRFNPFGL